MKRRLILCIIMLLAGLCLAVSAQAVEYCTGCGTVLDPIYSADMSSCSYQCNTPNCDNKGNIVTYDHNNICIGQTCKHCGLPGLRQHPEWVTDSNNKYLKSSATCKHPATYYMICRACGASSNSDKYTFVVGYENPDNHVRGKQIVGVNATCTTSGIKPL